MQSSKQKVQRSHSFNYSKKKWNLSNSAEHRSIIRTRHDLIELGQPQTANHLLMSFRRGYEASVILNANLAICRRLSFFALHLCFWTLCFSRHTTKSS